VQAALKGVAGKGRHDNVGAMLRIDPQREREEPDVTSKERLAAVDLLHAIGDQTAIDWLLLALDDSHNVVQRNAINALRDLLEQSGPMEGSSVFQQIKEAERIREVAKQKRG
jgi:HEAT repeat protein